MSAAKVKNLNNLQLIKTEENPDTVEWCPIPGYHDVLVCGTYELLEQDESSTPAHLMKRKGSIAVYKLMEESKTELKLMSSIKTDAILDSKWAKHCNSSGEIILGSVDAKGKLVFYSLNTKDSGNTLTELECICVADKGLSLSMDWCPKEATWSSGKVAVSDSNGNLSICELSSDGADVIHSWKCHDHEAWMTVFNTWDANVVYSGGDDCKFCGWDARSGSKAIFKNSTHQAGVCSIQCNSNAEFQIATGSYDEFIRIWDTRNIKRTPLSELSVGGGVWRIKWNFDRKNIMVAACMYNGFKILECNETLQVLCSFNNQDGSLAYGVDWSNYSPITPTVRHEESCVLQSYLIAGCTFYDRSIHLSQFQLDML